MHLHAIFERAIKRLAIGVLNEAADRQTVSELRDFDSERPEQLRDVKSGRLTLNAGVRGENDFANRLGTG